MPYAYIIFNPDMTGMLIVDVRKTRAKWVQAVHYGGTYKCKRNFYECPIEDVAFRSFRQ